MKEINWYWTIQIVTWTLYACVGIVIYSYFLTNSMIITIWQFVGALTMLLSTHLLRFKIKLDGWLNLPVGRLILYLIPALIILSFLANGITTGFGVLFTDAIPAPEFSFLVFLLYTLQTFIYLALWTGIYVGIKFFRNYKREEIEKWKLQSALKDAELIALKAQINPHFLFNALNNIRAMILEDQLKARNMVTHLSELLRYSIQFNNNEKVTVEDELDIVNKYLELESIHYEDRLIYQILADKQINTCKIPPMIIQLMAENAVKHGISQVKKGGEIVVKVGKEKEELEIEVSNTGKLKKNEKNGIGIRNATERIRILFDKEPDFELFQDGKQVKSIIKLPIQK